MSSHTITNRKASTDVHEQFVSFNVPTNTVPTPVAERRVLPWLPISIALHRLLLVVLPWALTGLGLVSLLAMILHNSGRINKCGTMHNACISGSYGPSGIEHAVHSCNVTEFGRQKLRPVNQLWLGLMMSIAHMLFDK